MISGAGEGPGSGRPLPVEAADGAHGHVVVAQNLAGQAHAGEPAFLKLGRFCFRHLRRLPIDELHAARRAPGVAAARVQHVHLRVLFDRQHEPLSLRHVDRPESLNRQLWHVSLLFRPLPPRRIAGRPACAPSWHAQMKNETASHPVDGSVSRVSISWRDSNRAYKSWRDCSQHRAAQRLPVSSSTLVPCDSTRRPRRVPPCS